MEVFEAIEKRRSIRKYKPVKIQKDHLKKILESARLAPSAHNWQPWEFIVVKSPKSIKRIATEGVPKHQMFIADAGTIVVAISDPESRPMSGPSARPASYWVRRSVEWYKMDTMIAVEHMILTSQSLGYGTCWIGTFEEKEVKEILGVPEKKSIVALLTIGIPDEDPKPRSRKNFNDIFYDEEYGKNLMI